jgi:hypothetical protein
MKYTQSIRGLFCLISASTFKRQQRLKWWLCTLLIFLGLTTLNGFRIVGGVGTASKYIKIDGFKHPTRHELILKRNSTFVLNEKNFKGEWITQGNWTTFGDTLTLFAKNKTTITGWIFKKKNEEDFLFTRKYFIVQEGLKENKTSEELAYYSWTEWKKKGRWSDFTN